MEEWQLVEAEADDPRVRLVETARRLLEAGGPEAVQARKLASEIGASTMAVYTHLGGMAELFEALVREGFVSLRAQVEAVPVTDDPMADFFVQGMAYRQWALENPQLYRLMFGMSNAILPRRVIQDMTTSGTISLLPEGAAAFEVMIRSLERVKAFNQIEQVDTVAAAGQFLSATHGYVLLEMADYFGPSGQGFATVLGPLAVSLMVGLGADRHDVDRSIASALVAVGIG
jgi:AcrR family transcriptional regulator